MIISLKNTPHLWHKAVDYASQCKLQFYYDPNRPDYALEVSTNKKDYKPYNLIINTANPFETIPKAARLCFEFSLGERYWIRYANGETDSSKVTIRKFLDVLTTSYCDTTENFIIPHDV